MYEKKKRNNKKKKNKQKKNTCLIILLGENSENKRKKIELEEIKSESFLQLFKHMNPQIIKYKWVPSKINFKNPHSDIL